MADKYLKDIVGGIRLHIPFSQVIGTERFQRGYRHWYKEYFKAVKAEKNNVERFQKKCFDFLRYGESEILVGLSALQKGAKPDDIESLEKKASEKLAQGFGYFFATIEFLALYLEDLKQKGKFIPVQIQTFLDSYENFFHRMKRRFGSSPIAKECFQYIYNTFNERSATYHLYKRLTVNGGGQLIISAIRTLR